MDNGFRVIEIPLNSPDHFRSIEILAKEGGNDLLAGAGTVTRIEQVHRIRECGGRLVVSPNCAPDIISETRRYDMLSLPGVVTPTEAMVALSAGASGLKLFPAEIITPQGVKALKAVIPGEIPLVPVGSIDAYNWRPYRNCGAAGFGLGSSLFKAGITMQELTIRARKFVESLR
jgi:2-dehydro-3-deoxyphosphogalactonate aldolase